MKFNWLIIFTLGITFSFCSSSFAFNWQSLWLTKEQQANRALAHGDPRGASKLFTTAPWRGVANYRAGNFKQAAKDFKQPGNATMLYDRGNALARMGDYDSAIKSYEQALKLQPDFADAKYNRDLLKQIKQQKLPPKSTPQSSQQQEQKEPKPSERKEHPKEDDTNNQTPAPNDESQSPRRKRFDKDRSSQQPANNPANALEAKQNGKSSNPEASQAKSQQTKQDRLKHEEKQATQQWLRRIPDDPGKLLQNIFARDYEQRLANNNYSEDSLYD